MAAVLYVFRCLLVSCLALDLVRAECTIGTPFELSRKYTMDSITSKLPFMPGKITTKKFGEFTSFDNHFCVGEHTGSHMDAPSHFNSTGWSIDDIPAERFFATGAFLDVSADVAAKKADFRLTKEYIDKWVESNGEFLPNTVLLIKFGWGQYYANPSDYVGTESSDMANGKWPGLDPEAARYLAGKEQIVGVGVDLPSMDPPNQGEVHVALAASNLYNLENLDLDPVCLPETGFKIYALPMNIQKGTGAPVRVFAYNENVVTKP